MSRGWGRAAGMAALFICSVPIVAWVIWFLWTVEVSQRENRAYAGEVFADVVAYDTVLASKKWFSVRPMDVFALFGTGRFECIYVVVQLSPDAPLIPPTDEGQDDTRMFAAGREVPWQPGPAPWTGAADTVLGDCTLWGGLEDYREVLVLAARDPEAWWRAHSNENYLYSARYGVAAFFELAD